MKTLANIVGILMIIAGAVWTLQGVGLIGGSFMTGAREWIWIGVATAAAGLGLMFLVNWRRDHEF